MRDQDFFWNGVDQGKLLCQKCSDCGTVRQPPGPMCPNCQSLHATTQEIPGRGIVVAWIVSHHPTQRDGRPRMVILVEFEGGVRMISNLVDARDRMPWHGMKVEVIFDGPDDARLPLFRPAGDAA
jgi:uncharacterized OB-fold protein